MDPYVELQAAWPDFHNRLIAEICNELGARLTDSYVARVDERIEVASWPQEPPRSFRPDVLVGRFEPGTTSSGATLVAAPATALKPKLVEIPDRVREEVRITWVEIRALPNLELVTVVEVLSPINKWGHGRQVYLERAEKLHASRVNVVAIDLLLGGAPLPLKERIEPGAYYAIVARGERLPLADLYRWSVRDPIPQLPIPLREPDADIWIDLAALVDRVYNLGRYARTLRYDAPLPESTSLAPEDLAWVLSQSSDSKHANG
jgi:hypothetical protein